MMGWYGRAQRVAALKKIAKMTSRLQISDTMKHNLWGKSVVRQQSLWKKTLVKQLAKQKLATENVRHVRHYDAGLYKPVLKWPGKSLTLIT